MLRRLAYLSVIFSCLIISSSANSEKYGNWVLKYYIDEFGDKIDLSGAARFNSAYGGGTNEEIRKILGTFDDFILTSLSLQTNGMDFLDKKQAERKKILS